MIRSNCSECSSARLTWMPASRLASRVAPEHRADTMQVVALLGSDCEAWLCKDCDGFGVLQVGTFDFF